MAHVPEHYLQKVAALVMALPTANPGDAAIGVVTLGTLIIWPRLGIRSARPPACAAGGLCGDGNRSIFRRHVATIGSQFHYILADGSQVATDPSCCRSWCCRGICLGSGFHAQLASLRALLPAAFSMAMLGAIESLLCAVVLDGMTGTKAQSQQRTDWPWSGNIVALFFGGITATAAIARSAA